MSPSDFNRWLSAAPAERRPLVMGVLNVTPDSFSDGGRFSGEGQAIAAAVEMAAAGADLIDIGGESTRPGALPVEPEEQIRRVVPVVRAVRKRLEIAMSIDTTRAAVAAAALDAGADIINDIAAGRDDHEMFPLTAKRGAPLILMHMQGIPATMQANPTYQDVTAEVRDFLQERAAAAQESGIPAEKILLDPGIGFGKSTEHNLQLLRSIADLVSLGRPVVLGTSRKGFIGKVIDEPDPLCRQFGTAATVAWGISNGAAVVRVHEVGPMVQVVKMVEAIRDGN